MAKRLLIFALIVFVCFPIRAFGQEVDPVLARIEELKKSYLEGNTDKSLYILTEIENLLREKSVVGEKNHSELMPLMDILNIEMLMVKNSWELSIAYAQAKYRPKDNKEVLKDLSSWLQHKPVKNERKGQIAEYELALKYQNELETLFGDLGLIGRDFGLFLHNDKEIPVRFANIDGKTCLLITKVATVMSHKYLD